jgi:hypothetical protein
MMTLIERARRVAQESPPAKKKAPMSKTEARLKKAMDAAQMEMQAAQKRFDAACGELVDVRCEALGKKLAKKGLKIGMRVTDGVRLWGYDGVQHDTVSRDPAAVRPRLLLVRKNGALRKQAVPVPSDLDLEDLRPVRDEDEVENILSKGAKLNERWTDYPFEELGDTPGQKAPIRRCTPLSSDGNKYVRVLVEGVEAEIKFGYIYTLPGRCGVAPVADWHELPVEGSA